MGELLCSLSLPLSDLHNLGSVLNQDFHIDSPEKKFGSPEMEFSNISTGYLEDAVIGKIKRRRLSFYNNDHQPKLFDDISQNNWGLSEDNSCMSSQNATPRGRTGYVDEDERNVEETFSVIYESPNTSSSLGLTSSSSGIKRKKRVVYPFALVKPGGDDVTLNDINESIMMPPTRPVRHPVGDFACRPYISAHGYGLSGKAIVALTRIYTHGRGTITIIRTKG